MSTEDESERPSMGKDDAFDVFLDQEALNRLAEEAEDWLYLLFDQQKILRDQLGVDQGLSAESRTELQNQMRNLEPQVVKAYAEHKAANRRAKEYSYAAQRMLYEAEDTLRHAAGTNKSYVAELARILGPPGETTWVALTERQVKRYQKLNPMPIRDNPWMNGWPWRERLNGGWGYIHNNIYRTRYGLWVCRYCGHYCGKPNEKPESVTSTLPCSDYFRGIGRAVNRLTDI